MCNRTPSLNIRENIIAPPNLEEDYISLDAVLPAIPEEADSVRRILLLPGAAVPGIGIQLSNRHGSRRIVRLDPMTGFPRVESVEAK